MFLFDWFRVLWIILFYIVFYVYILILYFYYKFWGYSVEILGIEYIKFVFLFFWFMWIGRNVKLIVEFGVYLRDSGVFSYVCCGNWCFVIWFGMS